MDLKNHLPIDQLQSFHTINSTYNPYTLAQYPWITILTFVGIWILSIIIERLHFKIPVLLSRKPTFAILNFDAQRSTIVYVVHLIVTTIVLGLLIHGGFELIFLGSDLISTSQINSNMAALTILSCLNVWELFFRVNMDSTLLLHHVIATLLLQLGTATIINMNSIFFLRQVMIGQFHSCTEQLCTVVIYFYRLRIFRGKNMARMLYASSLYMFASKVAITMVFLYYFMNDLYQGHYNLLGSWGLFWKFFTIPVLIVLFSTQVQIAYVYYLLGVKCERNEDEKSNFSKSVGIQKVNDTTA